MRRPSPTAATGRPSVSVLDRLAELPPPAVLASVFALPALEASAFLGVVIPAEAAVLLGGVLAHEQVLPLWAVIAAAVLGAVIGDSVGYEVGRRYGDALLARAPRRLVKPASIDRARQVVARRGGPAVLIGRFTAA